MSKKNTQTVERLFDWHVGDDGYAEAPTGQRWAVQMEGRQRLIENIDGPFHSRRIDGKKFTLGFAENFAPLTCGSDGFDLVTVLTD